MEKIPLSKIRVSKHHAVDKLDPDYVEGLQSVTRIGLRKAITVAPPTAGMYTILDGVLRYNWAKDAGLSTIDCYVVNADKPKLNKSQMRKLKRLVKQLVDATYEYKTRGRGDREHITWAEEYYEEAQAEYDTFIKTIVE